MKGRYKLICGDSVVKASLLDEPIDAVLADPPYGVNQDTKYTRFTGGVSKKNDFKKIEGDDAAFDPTPWIKYPKVCLFGFNSFSSSLDRGSVLVWLKRREQKIGKFLSDCELAWMKGGYGVYMFWHVWDGFDRASERGKSLHPSQKPVKLMEWCLDKMNVPIGATVLDPYMGSGPVGVACMNTGRKFIGIEKDPDYFRIAVKRIQEAAKAN